MTQSELTAPPAQRRRAFVRTALVVAVALAAAAVAFGIAATSQADLGPVTITVGPRPAADGGTTLALPPFGTVSADTHAGPLAVDVTLIEVDVERLQDFAAEGTLSDETVIAVLRDLRAAALRATLLGVLAAVAIAAFVVWALLRSRRLATVVAAGVVVVAIGSASLAMITYRTEAFAAPVWEGALRYAPGAFSLTQVRIAEVEELQRQVRWLARDLAAYYGVEQSFAVGGSLSDTYRVLHVSDLHLDPVGMQLALDLASAYDVELIIDTGDITHFGTAQESALVLAQLGRRPYVFVPGNHDSQEIAAALAGSGRVSVLDGETTTTARGLVILGIGDPAGAGSDIEPDSTLAGMRGREVARALGARTSPGLPSPDVVAVHDPATGVPFAGTVPVVLSGHTHTAMLEWVDDTVFLGSGTTGGVHFTELTPDPHIPHGASILYFSVAEPGRLVAIDQIEVYGKTRQSTIRRTIVDEALLGQ
ncbi:MAG: metallophosphoesterase [Coriobacteriia bacterium]|nr:metallophosphoesterase [Coriobacteriia bacterium]